MAAERPRTPWDEFDESASSGIPNGRVEADDAGVQNDLDLESSLWDAFPSLDEETEPEPGPTDFFWPEVEGDWEK